jgi:hypothetical protein
MATGADISRVQALPRDAERLIDPEPTVKNYDLAMRAIGCSPSRAAGPR